MPHDMCAHQLVTPYYVVNAIQMRVHFRCKRDNMYDRNTCDDFYYTYVKWVYSEF